MDIFTQQKPKKKKEVHLVRSRSKCGKFFSQKRRKRRECNALYTSSKYRWTTTAACACSFLSEWMAWELRQRTTLKVYNKRVHVSLTDDMIKRIIHWKYKTAAVKYSWGCLLSLFIRNSVEWKSHANIKQENVCNFIFDIKSWAPNECDIRNNELKYLKLKWTNRFVTLQIIIYAYLQKIKKYLQLILNRKVFHWQNVLRRSARRELPSIFHVEMEIRLDLSLEVGKPQKKIKKAEILIIVSPR